jgi:hypothetical protein
VTAEPTVPSAGAGGYFHVGLLVEDIEAAGEHFSAQLGLRFEPPRLTHPVTGEDVRVAYSLTGPPYLELIEMTGDGLFSRDRGGGFHHLGALCVDVPALVRSLDRVAGSYVCLVRLDGEPRVILELPPPPGVPVEWVDRGLWERRERAMREPVS